MEHFDYITPALVIVLTGVIGRWLFPKIIPKIEPSLNRFLEETLWRVPPWKWVKHNPLRLKELERQKQQQQQQ